MDDPVTSPGERGDFPDTNPVPAPLPDAITAALRSVALPVIEPLATDTFTRGGVADVRLIRAVHDATLDAVEEIAALESRLAAAKAQLLERAYTVSHLESSALGMFPWQEGTEEQSVVSEVAAILTVPEGTAAMLVHQSVSLVRDQHRTLKKLAAGELTWKHATTIVDEILSLQGATAVPQSVVDGFEQELLDVAPGRTSRSFKDKARGLRERAHPGSIVTRARQAREQRRMELSADRDGMSWLTLYMPAESAQGVWNECTRIARSLQGPTEPRTLTQLRLDAAVTYLLGQTPQGLVTTTAGGSVGEPSPTAQVLVLVPALSALGVTDEPAELEGYGPIPASVARKLLANSETFLRVLTDPITGEHLDLAPDTYRVRTRERLALRARDQACSFPTCPTVTADTELDHLTAWADDGKSTAKNTKHHCRKHHLLKHHRDDKNRDGTPAHRPPGRDPSTGKPAPPERIRGWRTTTDENGFTGWTSPAGRHYPADPPTSHPPEYPPWLTDLINQRTGNQQDTGQHPPRPSPAADYYSPRERTINYRQRREQ